MTVKSSFVRPLGMREVLSRQLNAARRWLALAAAAGAVGTWVAIPVQLTRTNVFVFDIWLHAGSGLVLTAAAGWLLLTRGSVLRFSIILLMVESFLLTLRMAVGFVTADPLLGVSEVLPPLSPWVPLIFVLGFMLLPLQEALYFSCVHMIVLMISAAVFVTQAPELMGTSYDMLNIALQYLCMHPLLVLMLYLIARITHHQLKSLRLAYEDELARSGRLERDDRHAVLSRPGFLELLERILAVPPTNGDPVLVECRLEGLAKQKSLHDDAIEATIKKLLNCLKSASGQELIFGRMDFDSIMVLIDSRVQDDAQLEALRQQLAVAASGCQPGLKLHIEAVRLERGMTTEIAFQALELSVLQKQTGDGRTNG